MNILPHCINGPRMNSEKRIQKTEVALSSQGVSSLSGKCPDLFRTSHETQASEETLENSLFRVSNNSVSRSQLGYTKAFAVFISRGGSIRYDQEPEFSPNQAPSVLSLSTKPTRESTSGSNPRSHFTPTQIRLL